MLQQENRPQAAYLLHRPQHVHWARPALLGLLAGGHSDWALLSAPVFPPMHQAGLAFRPPLLERLQATAILLLAQADLQLGPLHPPAQRRS